MNIFLNGHLMIFPDTINGLKTDINIYVDKTLCKFSPEFIQDLNDYFTVGCHSIRARTKDEIFGLWKFSYSLWRALTKVSMVTSEDPWIILAMSMSYVLLNMSSRLAGFYVKRFVRKFNNCIMKVLNETFSETDTEALKEIFGYFRRTWSGEIQVSLMLLRLIDNIIIERPESLVGFREHLCGHLENIIIYKVNPIRSN